MRRSGRMSVVAALVVAAWPASSAGQSEEPGVYGSQGELGGAFSVQVPPGAAPAGTTITVVSRDPSERPDELKAVPMDQVFYEVGPSDVRFSAPATVMWSVAFGPSAVDGYDPALDGLIVGSLFTRAADGTWSWLEDGEVRLDAADSTFTLTATTVHGGPIMLHVPGSLMVAPEVASNTPVGQVFRVEGQLRVDPSSRSDISSVSGATSDETIAISGSSYDIAFFDRAEGLEFQCLAPGTVSYETRFSIRDIADVSPLVTAIGLTGTDVAVIQTGEHRCG